MLTFILKNKENLQHWLLQQYCWQLSLLTSFCFLAMKNISNFPQISSGTYVIYIFYIITQGIGINSL